MVGRFRGRRWLRVCVHRSSFRGRGLRCRFRDRKWWGGCVDRVSLGARRWQEETVRQGVGKCK